MADDDVERLKEAARNRWSDEWAVEVKYWADGERDVYAYRQRGTSDPNIGVRERLFIGSDGAIHQDRIRFERETVLDREDVDEPPKP